MINELVESYKTYIEKIPNGALIIAEYLRVDDVENALIQIKNFSEGVIWLFKANEILVSHEMVDKLDIQDIEEFLLEINNGLEKQDYVLVADIFEYEISEFFKGVNSIGAL